MNSELTIYQKALVPVLTALVNRAVLAAGLVLTTHGAATTEQVNQVAAPLTQIVVGSVLAGAGLLWGLVRAKTLNDRTNAALIASPADPEVKVK